MSALKLAASLKLPDWCIAAGFVRNLVWDRLHAYSVSTPLNDIDLIYFDPMQASRARDKELEDQLSAISSLPWSVKNQARMHVRNGDACYQSTSHAMKHWVEVETAVGAYTSRSGELKLKAPFGVRSLLAGSITLNATRQKPTDFRQRLEDKRWLELWPLLKVQQGSTVSANP
ncbi:MAG: nucleotidyltransferase family protein [Pseudomonadota bacterium]